MNPKSNVLRATGIVALGVFLLSILMELIYLIVVLAADSITYDYTFPLGNLLMAAAVILNFYLMSYTIQTAVSSGDPALAKKRIQLSGALRNLMMVGFLVIAFLVPVFHFLPAVITIVFPQITIFASRIFIKDKPPVTPPADATPGGEEEHGET